ncbi:methylmalonyl-CoA mutase family protein [Algoriphagus marincola]|uniref:methylmalonyl-CoA mutase family protein n=1 Tax=Algoriphagus marincola TaxID=264027 RepID=UPI0004260AA5|nr:methylmalonyl-CoA mutase family protein [Algoriphagus marincola]
MTNPDFFPFQPTSKSDWRKQIEKDLKGKNFEETLESKIWSIIKQSPYYDSYDSQGLATQLRFHPEPELSVLGPRIWSNAVEITAQSPKEANQSILNHLQNGADALIIHSEESTNWPILLKGVLLEYISLFIQSKDGILGAISFLNFIEKEALNKENLRGAILWSPTGSLFEEERDWTKALKDAHSLTEKTKPYPNFSPMTFDFARYANAGATGLTEVEYGLGEIIETASGLKTQGVELQEWFSKICIHTAVGESHFPEMVKLKAIRILTSELAKKFDVNLGIEQIQVIASSSLWTKSLIDKNNNFIRQTYEGLAGILGGCNVLWVRKWDSNESDALNSRIARNVSSVLKEESYLDKVMDPMAGSFYLESLQKEFIELIQAAISKLEKEGGWLSKFQAKSLHQRVKSERLAAQEKVKENQRSKVGVNRYQASGKLINNSAFQAIQESGYELQPSRETYLIEQEILKK